MPLESPSRVHAFGTFMALPLIFKEKQCWPPTPLICVVCCVVHGRDADGHASHTEQLPGQQQAGSHRRPADGQLAVRRPGRQGPRPAVRSLPARSVLPLLLILIVIMIIIIIDHFFVYSTILHKKWTHCALHIRLLVSTVNRLMIILPLFSACWVFSCFHSSTTRRCARDF